MLDSSELARIFEKAPCEGMCCKSGNRGKEGGRGNGGRSGRVEETRMLEVTKQALQGISPQNYYSVGSRFASRGGRVSFL